MSEYVAIVGSRDYPRLYLVREYVATLPPDTVIVSGGAIGVDSIAAQAARHHGLEVIEYLPNWRPNGVYDKSAGFRRNAEIVAKCDRLVAFHANGSRGTAHSIGLAQKAGKPVLVFDKNGDVQP